MTINAIDIETEWHWCDSSVICIGRRGSIQQAMETVHFNKRHTDKGLNDINSAWVRIKQIPSDYFQSLLPLEAIDRLCWPRNASALSVL